MQFKPTAERAGRSARYLLDALTVAELRAAALVRIEQCERQADSLGCSVRVTFQRLPDCVTSLVGVLVAVHGVGCIVGQSGKAHPPGLRHGRWGWVPRSPPQVSVFSLTSQREARNQQRQQEAQLR